MNQTEQKIQDPLVNSNPPEVKFNRKNFGGILIALIMVAAAVGLSKFNSASKSEPEPKAPEAVEFLVPATSISPGTHAPLIKSTATVEAWQESQLAAQVSGKVVWMCDCLETGNEVKKDTVLAKIEAVDYQVAVAQAKQAMADAKQKIAEEEARAEQARVDWEQLNLGQPTDLALRKPQLETANATLERRKMELQQANRNLKRTQIKAPYAGIITARNTNVGNFIGMGSSLGTILNTEKVQVRFAMKPDDVNKLDTENSEITIYNSNDKSLVWPAKIERIDSIIDPKTRLVNVIAEVQNPFDTSVHSNALRVGSFVSAEFKGQDTAGVYALPSSAVLSDQSVYTVAADSTVQILKAELVHRNPDSILVRIPAANNQAVNVISEGQGAYSIGQEVKLVERDKNYQMSGATGGN